MPSISLRFIIIIIIKKGDTKEEARNSSSLRPRGLSPLHVEDEVVVAEAVEGGDGLGRVLLLVVVDEGEALALAGDLVLGQEDAGDRAERLEELLQVCLRRVLGEVGHADGRGVLVCNKEKKSR